MRNWSKLSLLGLLLVGYSAKSETVSVGAYAVANHRLCGVSSIPGTIRELDKFFAHPDFASIGTKNFYWKDARVRNNDWAKDTDFKVSTETMDGHDGADASLLSYIASHGVTSNGLYKALAGSKENGGCYIPSSSLELGNQMARYTILSTCQGLKIGTGDNPTAVGENPSKTWKTSGNGLNCILGYSNNMADEDGYGVYLLEKMKSGEVSLAEAFMSASEAVSADNVPAVLCYGETQEDAEAFIAESKSFSPEQRSNTASAFVFRKTKSMKSDHKALPTAVPSSIRVEFESPDFQKIAKSVRAESNYNEKTNHFSIRDSLSKSRVNTRSEAPSEEESIKIAASALVDAGLASSSESLIVDSTSQDVLGGEQGITKVLSRKIRFKQNLAGFKSLGQAGSIEVVVDASGQPSEIAGSLLKVVESSNKDVSFAKMELQKSDYEAKAIKAVSTKYPDAQYRVVSQHVGYDAGNFFEVKKDAKAVVEITVEATQGEISRRFIERIAL